MGNICRSSKTTDTNLSQKQLDKLHELTNIPQREILIYYRQFIIASPTGRMTHLQFENQLKTMGASTDGSKAIFEMIDKDNSGQISFQEYLLSIVTFSHQSQPEQQLGAVFDTYQALSRQNFQQSFNDLHQQQGMKRDDIEHMLKRIHPELSKENLDELCDRYMNSDQNKNGYISKQEFIAACMKNSKLMEQLGYKDATIEEHSNENEN
jgi:Ca2+-binding EF-hand superfamily protein